MKYLILMIGLLANTAMAQDTVYLNPGECVLVGSTNVCAQRTISYDHGRRHDRDNRPVIVVESRPENTESVQAIGVCELSTGKSPNTWNLYRVGGTVSRTNRMMVKSFAHFEESKCQAEASKMGQ